MGWLLLAELWAELEPKWPKAFWDDWMRRPEQRQGRAFLRPEISRTMTFGRKGVSHGQFFDQHLKFIKLNQHFVPFTQAAFPCSGSHRQVWALLLGLTPPPFGGGAGSGEMRTDRFVARMRPSKGVSSSRSGQSLLGCQGLCLPPISPFSSLLVTALLSLQPSSYDSKMEN